MQIDGDRFLETSLGVPSKADRRPSLADPAVGCWVKLENFRITNGCGLKMNGETRVVVNSHVMLLRIFVYPQEALCISYRLVPSHMES